MNVFAVKFVRKLISAFYFRSTVCGIYICQLDARVCIQPNGTLFDSYCQLERWSCIVGRQKTEKVHQISSLMLFLRFFIFVACWMIFVF